MTTTMTTNLSTEQTESMIVEAQSQAQRIINQKKQDKRLKAELLHYRYHPAEYIADKLGWTPWAGDGEHPGQVELLDAYAMALRQQHERRAFEKGHIALDDLKYWTPGVPIQYRLRVESGHGVGKCVAASEWLTLADGRRVQARQLIGKSFELTTLVDGEFRKVEARAEFNTTEPVYAITTESGKRIVRNAHHPLWGASGHFEGEVRVTGAGWIPMVSFAPGDLAAVAERIPEPDSDPYMTDDEVNSHAISGGALSVVFGLRDRQLSNFISSFLGTRKWSVGAFGSAERARDIQQLLLRFGIHGSVYARERSKSWFLVIDPVREAENSRWNHIGAIPGTRWERVVSVDPVGIEDTVAIEVPGNNTFLTTFFEHNTKVAAGIVSHFFDTCTPSIIYTFAPSYPQINDLLWKEIRTDREGRKLPGKILQSPELKYRKDHFAKGRATDNANGNGSENVQGQHNKYLMFVMDEAEGVSDFVFDAINAMTTGGIVIVLMLANPKTRTSKFYKVRTRPDTRSFRISCIWHPNVIQDKELVPGAVRRDYVEGMLFEHCQVVDKHESEKQTFEVPWHPGVIYLPDTEFMFRVLGVPPSNNSDDTLIPVGRYEAATKRKIDPELHDKLKARLGCDVARFGNDMGSLYVSYNGNIWREKQFPQLDTNAYCGAILELARKLHRKGVRSFHLRVDAGGGFSSGIVDPLKGNEELTAMFSDFKIIEVDFGGVARDKRSYADCATEMYAETSKTLDALHIQHPPEHLEEDLTERVYRWINRAGVAVKQLEPKDNFRKRLGRSPDDGDGFVMAASPDHIFRPKKKAGVW